MFGRLIHFEEYRATICWLIVLPVPLWYLSSFRRSIILNILSKGYNRLFCQSLSFTIPVVLSTGPQPSQSYSFFFETFNCLDINDSIEFIHSNRSALSLPTISYCYGSPTATQFFVFFVFFFNLWALPFPIISLLAKEVSVDYKWRILKDT